MEYTVPASTARRQAHTHPELGHTPVGRVRDMQGPQVGQPWGARGFRPYLPDAEAQLPLDRCPWHDREEGMLAIFLHACGAQLKWAGQASLPCCVHLGPAPGWWSEPSRHPCPALSTSAQRLAGEVSQAGILALLCPPRPRAWVSGERLCESHVYYLLRNKSAVSCTFLEDQAESQSESSQWPGDCILGAGLAWSLAVPFKSRVWTFLLWTVLRLILEVGNMYYK